MKNHEKRAKKDDIRRNDTFILIDSPSWRNPQHLDMESLRDILDVSSDSSSNVYAFKFKNQDTDPRLPPDAKKLEKSIELAVDDNFLYVWVKNRWKRIPLSSF